jgi:hypothetical protein
LLNYLIDDNTELIEFVLTQTDILPILVANLHAQSTLSDELMTEISWIGSTFSKVNMSDEVFTKLLMLLKPMLTVNEVGPLSDLCNAFKNLSSSASDKRLNQISQGECLGYLTEFLYTHITESSVIDPGVNLICSLLTSSDSQLIDKIC